MNKTHRIVWSESRGAFIVAHEFAATSGKRSSTKSIISHSLAVAALVASSAPVMAQTVVLNPAYPTYPNLVNPAGIVIQGTSGGPGVAVFGSQAGAITNSGTILGSTAAGDSDLLYGIYVGSGGALSGGITNSGTASSISGVMGGINLATGSTLANVLNQGRISASTGYGIRASGGALGVVTNSGATSQIMGGDDGVKLTGGASASGIVNAGTISGGTADAIWVSGVGTTLSSVSNTGVLTGGTYGISVENNGSVGSIVNSSAITGVESGINVSLDGSVGSITNASTGVIQGLNGDGIEVNNGTVGSIINAGRIAGSSSGIAIFSAGHVGSITNSGTIAGANSGGVVLYGAGTLGSLTNSGVISSGASAIGVYNGATVGSITNSGSVLGGNSHDAISVFGGTVGSISNSGTMSGGYAGIQLQGGSTITSVANSGKISGGEFGIISAGLTNVTNHNPGTLVSNLIGSISNTGTITGQNAGIMVTNGTISGSITNGSGGVISATGTDNFQINGSAGQVYNPGGIIAYNASIGSIVNQQGGVISGANGIYLQNGTLGSLQNAGLISGTQEYGVALIAETAGSITNTGTMVGSVVGLVVVEGSLSGGIVNSGLLSGDYGLGITAGTLSGGVTNSGSITGKLFSGITVDEEVLNGGIHNLAGGVISGASGLTVYHSQIDSITNDAGGKILGLATSNGTITQPGYAGIALRSGATLTGNVSNAGLISGVTAGINLNGSASVIQGAIINSGTVMGGVAGILLNGTASTLEGGISNSGTIAGGQYGVSIIGLSEVTLSGGISNSGLISGTSVAGVYMTDTTVSGGITNATSGTISGGVAGVDLVTATLAGGINNAGAINGGQQGLLVAGSTITGGLVNSGVIAGGQTGIAVKSTSAISGGFVNSGVIAGSKYALNVDATSSIGPITIAGNNTAAFVGDVLALNSPVTVASGTYTGSNAFNVQSFDVAQGALLNMGVMASTAGENNGVTVSQGFTNEGTVSVARNFATITGDYTQAATGALGVGVSSKTNHGVLAVSGAADLSPAANIIVNVAANNSLTNKETIAGVLTSGDLTASTFNVTDNSDLISFKGLVDGNNVDLVTSFNALVLPDTLANKNANAVGAATVLDQIILASNGVGPFSGVINDIAKLQTSREVSNAASQTLPLMSGDYNLATYAALSQMNQVVQSRVAGNYGMSAGSPYTLDQNAWVKPFGSWANAGDQNGAPGFTSTVEGVALGGDAAISNAARVGLAFAYANVDASGNSHDAPNDDRINMYQLMGYGSYAIDPRTEVNAQIDGGINTNDGHRNIAFAGTTATSSFNSSDAHFGIGIARELPLSESTIFTPQVRVDYTWISSDDYTEGGAGPLSLHTQSTSFESLLTQINGKLTQKLNDNLTLFGNLGIGYDSMAHTNSSVIAAFTGAPGLSFSTEGVGLSPRALLGGIGVVSTPRGNMPEVSFRYDVQQREGFADQSISFKARWAF